MIEFKHTLWFLALILALLALIIGGVQWSFRERHRVELVSKRLLKRLGTPYSKLRFFSVLSLLSLSLILTIFGLARVILDKEKIESTVRGREVIIAIDVSKSMLTEDIRPSRLETARIIAFDLLKAMPEDKVGVIAFAGRAHMAAPMTVHQEALRDVIEFVDEDYIPFGGSNFVDMIEVAGARFSKGGLDNHALFILSDGEEHNSEVKQVIKLAKEHNIRINAVGIGTKAGELIPDTENPGQHYRDRSGRPVLSRLDDAGLKEMVQKTGGTYFPLSRSGDLENAVQSSLYGLSFSESDSVDRYIEKEGFQWFVAPALFLLVLALFILRPPFFFQSKSVSPSKSPLIVILFVLGFSVNSSEASVVKDILTYLKESNYEQAIEQSTEELEKERNWLQNMGYGKSQEDALYLIRGSAFFHEKLWAESLKDFSEVLKSDDVSYQAKANWGITMILAQQTWRRFHPDGSLIPELKPNDKTPGLITELTEDISEEIEAAILELESAKIHLQDFIKIESTTPESENHLLRIDDWLEELNLIQKQKSQDRKQQQNQQGQNGEQNQQGQNGEQNGEQNGQGGEQQQQATSEDFYRDKPEDHKENSENGQSESSPLEEQNEAGQSQADGEENGEENSDQEASTESRGENAQSDQVQQGEESSESEIGSESEEENTQVASFEEKEYGELEEELAERNLKNSADFRKMPARIKLKNNFKKPEKDW